MYPDEKHPSYGIFVRNFCDILDEIGIDHIDHVMLKSDSVIGRIVRYAGFYIGTMLGLLFEKYDVVYIHYASHSSIPVIIAHIFRKKPIYTNVHGSDVIPENSKQERMQRYTRIILSLSKRIIVPSEYFRKVVSRKYGINEEMICISPSGGVDGKVFFKKKDKDFDRVMHIGYVGRISYKKGWGTLLKACSELNIPYRLTVVGNGPERLEMKEMAADLGLCENIDWQDLLPQEELCEIYNDMDVLVFPSEREGESLGLVAIEAMACSTPVIASDYAAQAYYVVDGENGFKYECGNSGALAAKIADYYRLDPDKKSAMGVNAEKTAALYSAAKVKYGIRELLEKDVNYGSTN